jgi:glycosyltransferase involved in cell wall biosynthesis
MQPLVSIIITCYNSAGYINQTLDSVLVQTYSNIEIILVNDGSTDNSEELILSINDERIKYFFIHNQGQSKASNFGLSKASGDYIKFLDSDDLISSNHIELQLNIMNGRIDSLVSCEWGRFYDDNPASAVFSPEPVWQDLTSLEWIKISLSQRYDMMAAWLWLIPRKVISTTGGWDEKLTLNNDFEFSMRLLTSTSQVLFASGAKLFYRSGRISLSQKISLNALEDAILSTDIGCSHLLKLENSNNTRRLCADRYKEWQFNIYPSAPELEKMVKKKIEFLGGSNRRIAGGKVFHFFSFLLGWKGAKVLKLWVRNQGCQKLPFN